LELRGELTSQAEQQIIANAAQKEEALNVQQIVDKQTKELRVKIRKKPKFLPASKMEKKMIPLSVVSILYLAQMSFCRSSPNCKLKIKI